MNDTRIDPKVYQRIADVLFNGDRSSLQLEEIARNEQRQDFGEKRLFRVLREGRVECLAFVGPELGDLFDRSKRFQKACPNLAVNPIAREWWERHDLQPGRGRTKRIRLDTGDVVQLRQLVLEVVDEPDLRVISYFADADGDWDDVELDL